LRREAPSDSWSLGIFSRFDFLRFETCDLEEDEPELEVPLELESNKDANSILVVRLSSAAMVLLELSNRA
jgi:hypothetical protein